MSIRTYKPTSPSRRAMTNSTFGEITTSTPEKSLLVSLSKSAVEITKVKSPAATLVEVINVNIVLLTSNVIKTISQRLLKQSNTIQTAMRIFA